MKTNLEWVMKQNTNMRLLLKYIHEGGLKNERRESYCKNLKEKMVSQQLFNEVFTWTYNQSLHSKQYKAS